MVLCFIGKISQKCAHPKSIIYHLSSLLCWLQFNFLYITFLHNAPLRQLLLHKYLHKWNPIKQDHSFHKFLNICLYSLHIAHCRPDRHFKANTLKKGPYCKCHARQTKINTRLTSFSRLGDNERHVYYSDRKFKILSSGSRKYRKNT